MICAREILLNIKGYDTTFPRFEDWDLLLRISKTHNIGWFNKSLSDIHNDSQPSAKSEIQGLKRMKLKFSTEPKKVRRRVISSYWFHLAAVHFKHKQYLRFVIFIIVSWLKHPINHFPIKAIAIPKIRHLIAKPVKIILKMHFFKVS